MIRPVPAISLTGYHENVTEYGTHWNFFFTLAAVKVEFLLFRETRGVVTLFSLFRKKIRFSETCFAKQYHSVKQ
jgi:hypothetical protein